jgi:hypothetical protein
MESAGLAGDGWIIGCPTVKSSVRRPLKVSTVFVVFHDKQTGYS